MPDRISHLLRFSDLSVRDVSPAYIEEKVLVKISLENFEGKLEKFSDIGDVAGVIAVRKSKQFLEITAFKTRNAHGYQIVGVSYGTAILEHRNPVRRSNRFLGLCWLAEIAVPK